MATERHSEAWFAGAAARPGSLRIEVYGLLVLAFAVLFSLSLVSFDVRDLAPATGRDVANWVGPVGAHVADLFLTALGLAAYVAAGGALWWGIRLVRHASPRVRGAALAAVLAALPALCVLLHLVAGGAHPFGRPAGGLVGTYVGEVSRALLSGVGTFVLFGFVLFVAVAVLVRVRPWTLVRLAYGAVRRGVRALQAVLAARREARTEAQEPLFVEEAADVAAAAPSKAAARPTRRGRAAPPPLPPDALAEVPATVAAAAVAEPASVAGEPEPPLSPTVPFVPFAAGAGAAATALGAAPTPDVEPDVEPDPEVELDADLAPLPTRLGPPDPAIGVPVPCSTAASGSGPRIVESEAMRTPVVIPQTGPAAAPVGPADVTPDWQLPDLALLNYEPPARRDIDRDALLSRARTLEQKLLDFKVKGEVVEIQPGPVITMYEFRPAPGIKISRIANLADDLTMALAAERVRIVAPLPKKSVVGIEVPNGERETVYLKELFADESFRRSKHKLTLALGKDIVGKPVVANLSKMPHLLVAGATGAGKSVAINAFILSLLYRATPEEVRLILVDPKMLEFNMYAGIPHLLLPVVTDPKDASVALQWAVGEMDRRYRLMSDWQVRNILGYNNRVAALRRGLAPHPDDAEGDEPAGLEPDGFGDDPAALERVSRLLADGEVPAPMPFLVVIIDELADLMMAASKDVETSVARLAAKARAAGIHLVVATQRPSVDVVTGLIKANFPTRLSFQVATKVDSRTILDQPGAEKLLGMGDMLYLPPGASAPIRLQGAFVSDEEVARIADQLRLQGRPDYDMSILESADRDDDEAAREDEPYDEFWDQAVQVVAESRRATVSYLQRRLGVGYNRAARMIERMEREGIIGPADGNRPRDVFVQPL